MESDPEVSPQEDAELKDTKQKNFWQANSFREWKNEITDDENAPELYSKRAIYGFSVFFSALFGAILLAINAKRVGNKKAIPAIISFGVAYIIIIVLIGSYIPGSQSSSALVFGILGAMILNGYVWEKYLGSIKYRARSITTPLLIGMIMTCAAIFFVIYAGRIGDQVDLGKSMQEKEALVVSDIQQVQTTSTSLNTLLKDSATTSNLDEIHSAAQRLLDASINLQPKIDDALSFLQSNVNKFTDTSMKEGTQKDIKRLQIYNEFNQKIGEFATLILSVKDLRHLSATQIKSLKQLTSDMSSINQEMGALN